MIELIKTKGPWNSVLSEVDNYEFYHTYDYHLIAKGDFEEAVLIKYTESDKLIAIPLLFRKIPGTSYYDMTSVYGYPGPATKNVGADFDNSNFRKELEELFRNNKIVTVFSRLNCYMAHQEIVLKNIGEVKTAGRIVNIDLSNSVERLRMNYSRRFKTYINKARRNCFVTMADSEKEILQFIELYYETMHRVNAKSHYFFKKDYFFRLLKSKDFRTDILLVRHLETNEIIGGAMFIGINDIIQYHLSGAKEKYLALNPFKLLIDEMLVISTSKHYKFFNLGGGVGNKDDSLFHFKSGFSKDFRPFKLWEYVVNDEVYHDLIKEKEKKECMIFQNNCSEYFPCYRCNPKNGN